MSVPVIASLHFAGKTTYGHFVSPAQTFSVSQELIFSAVRVTIAGRDEGRQHETSVYINSPSGSYVNSVSMEVPDKEATMEGAFARLSRLFPDIQYQLEVSSWGFDGTTEEDVSVIVDLLELDSNVAEVTRNVLRDAEAEKGINAIAFGISEASFAHFMTAAQTAPEVEVGTTPYLHVRLNLQSYAFPWWPFVHIDVSAKEFVISGDVTLTFFHRQSGVPFPPPVAVVSVSLNVYCEPAMVTTTNDMLQLQFKRAEVVDGSLLVAILDATPTGILGGFASVPEFREAVNNYIAQMTSKTGPLGFALPAYLESRSLPDHWHHVLNMRLDFEHFSYQTVMVHNLPISYLFIVFSMRSLGLPPPCYCETDLTFLPEKEESAAAVTLRPSRRRLLGFLGEYTDYSLILAAAQISAFGLSEQSFQEIARPLASMGHDESASTGGTIYCSARFWFSTRLEEAKIVENGIKAVIDVTAEGSAKAAVRDKCGHDVLRASVRLRIRVDNSSITWSLRAYEEYPPPPTYGAPELTIEANPVADVGHIDVQFDDPLGLPPPLNQVDDWVLTTVTNSLRPVLKLLASTNPTIRFVRTIENNGSIRLNFVDDRFFPDEAAVLLGQLRTLSWQ